MSDLTDKMENEKRDFLKAFKIVRGDFKGVKSRIRINKINQCYYLIKSVGIFQKNLKAKHLQMS